MTFATEHNWDSLDFFDGVDANAPRLGSYSGRTDTSESQPSAPPFEFHSHVTGRPAAGTHAGMELMTFGTSFENAVEKLVKGVKEE